MRGLEVTEPEVLIEMPYLMTGTVNFGLDIEVMNQRRASRLKSLPHEVARSYPRGELIFKEDIGGGGQFAYINRDTKLIDYYMQFETGRVAGLGRSATQVKVWNSAESPSGITRYVFFDIMVPKYSTMMSDIEQSESGRRFWVSALGWAADAGLTVGLVDETKAISFYDAKEPLATWIRRLKAWGTESHHYARCFIISKLPAPTTAT